MKAERHLNVSMTVEQTSEPSVTFKYIKAALQPVIKDRDHCDAIAMVVLEMLENVVKYSDWSSPAAESACLNVRVSPKLVTIETVNPVVPNDEHLKYVLETIPWIARQESPLIAHHAKLVENSKTHKTTGKSRLGLTRIAYEGDCVLEAELDSQNNLLCIRAQAKITNGIL